MQQKDSHTFKKDKQLFVKNVKNGLFCQIDASSGTDEQSINLYKELIDDLKRSKNK
jgi:hypothetical protein